MIMTGDLLSIIYLPMAMAAFCWTLCVAASTGSSSEAGLAASRWSNTGPMLAETRHSCVSSLAAMLASTVATCHTEIVSTS